MTALEDFLELLPRPASLPPLLGQSESILQPSPKPDDFVAPSLTTDSQGDDGTVWLISAPAAVGKSWLAKFISASTGNPYWDLSEFRVGSNFFSGTIARAYGGHGYARLQDELRSSSAVLVVDAADEALVRVGVSNYEAALEDLANLLDGHIGSGPAVVLLGRPETIELSAVILEGAGLSWRRFGVDYFSEGSAKSFVQTKASHLEVPPPPVELGRFMDGFFKVATGALGGRDWSDVRSFLGYSPVLDALVKFASDENPYARLMRIASDETHGRFWSLMSQVVLDVCAREAEKFAKTFGGGDDGRRAIARESFSVDEQLRMLLSSSPDEDFLLPVDRTPDELVDPMIEAAALQLRDHPFLAKGGKLARVANPLLRFGSPVFRDFATAWALWRLSPNVAIELESAARDPRVSATPMLFRFMASDLVVREGSRLPGATLALVAQSSGAAGSGGLLRVVATAAGGPTTATPGDEVSSLLDVELWDDESRLVEFVVGPLGPDGIQLSRAVVNLLIDFPGGTVDLGAGMRDLSLGPAVTVAAGTVRVSAEEVRVVTSASSVVGLEAGRFESSVAQLRVLGGGALQVDAPGLYFPWLQHRFVPKRSSADVDLDDAARKFRRLHDWFGRPSIAGRLTYPRETMDKILAKGRADPDLFEYCQKVGLIEERGSAYVFHEPPSALASRVMDLTDPELRGFLERYVAWSKGGRI